jgi:hypothetical protein
MNSKHEVMPKVNQDNTPDDKKTVKFSTNCPNQLTNGASKSRGYEIKL